MAPLGPYDEYLRQKEFARQQQMGPDYRMPNAERFILLLGTASALVVVVFLVHWFT